MDVDLLFVLWHLVPVYDHNDVFDIFCTWMEFTCICELIGCVGCWVVGYLLDDFGGVFLVGVVWSLVVKQFSCIICGCQMHLSVVLNVLDVYLMTCFLCLKIHSSSIWGISLFFYCSAIGAWSMYWSLRSFWVWYIRYSCWRSCAHLKWLSDLFPYWELHTTLNQWEWRGSCIVRVTSRLWRSFSDPFGFTIGFSSAVILMDI
jgi:hypothetical protein